MTSEMWQDLDILACPSCHADLSVVDQAAFCVKCTARFELVDGIPDFLLSASSRLANEIKVQDEVAENYESLRYAKWYSRKYHEMWNTWMLEGLAESQIVLDLGCGTGWVSRAVNSDCVLGVDVSMHMLREARRQGCHVVRADAAKLPLRSDVFDAVISRSLLHHLEHPQFAVAEAARVLKPGGKAVFLDTNRSLLSTLPRFLAYRQNNFSETHQNLRFSRLHNLLSAEFQIERVRFFGYLAYPILGFPDLIDIFQYLPAKRFSFTLLTSVDATISRIPLINRQSWGTIVFCRKSTDEKG